MTTPAQHLVSFMGLVFDTTPDVLTPRPETELLGRTVLDLLAKSERSAPRIIDMCCGSGNLACSIAHARPDARVWASDLTDPCVALARKNVARHELGDRVTIHQGDLFGGLPQELEGSIDFVVCNPPYISSGKLANESAHLLVDEPREAFDGGPYGFSIHKRTIQDAPRFMRAGAWLAMEIGRGQENQIRSLFTRALRYEDPVEARDESGATRVMAARLKQGA
jgi:release factor glutamine methyltransferase